MTDFRLEIAVAALAIGCAVPVVANGAPSAPFPPSTLGWVVVTNTSANTSIYDPAGPVAKVWDVSNPAGTPAPSVWTSISGFTPTSGGPNEWSGRNLGQVFGIAIDSDPSGPFIYVAATAIYGGSSELPIIGGGCTNELNCYPGYQSLSLSSTASSHPFDLSPPAGAFATDSSGNPMYGTIWRLSLNGGLSSGAGTYELVANIPSSRVSLGQIAYAPPPHDRFYVSNFDDGMIYSFTRPALNGAPVTVFPAIDKYDHGLNGRTAAGLNAVPDVSNELFTPYLRRVWGVQYNPAEDRLYYAVWNLDFRNQTSSEPNQIWSVALDTNGRPSPATAQKEFDIPAFPPGLPTTNNSGSPNVPYSQPVSDIAFNQTGDVMLLAERGERIGRNFYGGYDTSMPNGNSALPHNSRILRYRKTSAGWVRDTGTDFGQYAGDTANNAAITGYHYYHANSAGGVDFGYDYSKNSAGKNISLNPAVPDGWTWNTANSYVTLGSGKVYGAQGSRRPARDAGMNVLLASGDDVYYVDYDADLSTSPKTMVGDVEVHRVPVKGGGSILKICKIAGTGVNVGTPFTFQATGSSGQISVPAGPPPGGYCVVGPSYATNTSVTVQETGPSATVTNITVAPPQAANINLAQGSVQLTLGPGVTEVTYTDEIHSGYIEICKSGDVEGNFSYKVPGQTGLVTVPAGACSPALLVNSGQITIYEGATPGTVMLNCSTVPANALVSCNPSNWSATVNVAGGNISTQTIVYFVNGLSGLHQSKRSDRNR